MEVKREDCRLISNSRNRSDTVVVSGHLTEVIAKPREGINVKLDFCALFLTNPIRPVILSSSALVFNSLIVLTLIDGRT